MLETFQEITSRPKSIAIQRLSSYGGMANSRCPQRPVRRPVVAVWIGCQADLNNSDLSSYRFRMQKLGRSWQGRGGPIRKRPLNPRPAAFQAGIQRVVLAPRRPNSVNASPGPRTMRTTELGNEPVHQRLFFAGKLQYLSQALHRYLGGPWFVTGIKLHHIPRPIHIAGIAVHKNGMDRAGRSVFGG